MNRLLFYKLLLDWLNIFSDIAVKGVIILVPSILASVILKKLSSQLKHLILFISICSIGVLPLLLTTNNIVKLSHNVEITSSGTVLSQTGVKLADQADLKAFQEPEAISNSGSAPAFFNKDIRVNWIIYIYAIWLLGFLVLIIRILSGQYGVYLIKKQSTEMDDKTIHMKLFSAVKKEMSIHRNVKLYLHSSNIYPFTVGVLYPAVILPNQALKWSDERIKLVLLHELAHVKRRDNLTQLIARIISAVYWFNPLVWVVLHLLRFEREKVCDERVLHSGVRSVEYASQLLDITRSFNALKNPIVLSSSMARKSDVETRILNILNPAARKGNLSFIKVAASILIIICMIVPLSLVSVSAFNKARNESNPTISVYGNKLTEFKDKKLGIDIKDAHPNEIPALFPFFYYDKSIRDGIVSKPGDYKSSKAGQLSVNNGIDIEITDTDSCIIATADGVIQKIAKSSEYGKYAVIKHKYGFYTLYANLGDVLRSSGDIVSAGEIIGITGKNKILHYELRFGSKPINPVSLYSDKKTYEEFQKIAVYNK